jgi:hypothetical protein
VLDHGSHPRPPRRVLAGVAVGFAVVFCPLLGVVGGLAASLMTYLVSRSSGPVTWLAPALAGGLVGALSGWAVSGWRRFGPWASAAVALAIVVVTELLFGEQDAARLGAVAWAAVLVPTLYTVGVLVRRGAPWAGAATGVVGGLLAVDAGVTSMLAWLLRDRSTDGPQLWLWFVHARSPFQPGIFGAVGFTPHWLIAGTAFAVCLVLVTQRIAVSPGHDRVCVPEWLTGGSAAARVRR